MPFRAFAETALAKDTPLSAALVLVKPDGSTVDVPMKRPRIVIGREKKCDIRIPTPAVSREHCEVRVENGQIMVRDMGSSNGTYVNAKRVQESELKAGDVVGIGPTVFVVRVNGAPAQVDGPAALAKAAPPPPVAAHKAGPAKKPAMDEDDFDTESTSEDSSISDLNFDFLDDDDDKKQPKL